MMLICHFTTHVLPVAEPKYMYKTDLKELPGYQGTLVAIDAVDDIGAISR